MNNACVVTLFNVIHTVLILVLHVCIDYRVRLIKYSLR